MRKKFERRERNRIASWSLNISKAGDYISRFLKNTCTSTYLDRKSVSLSFFIFFFSFKNWPLLVALSEKSNTMNAEEAPLPILPPFVAEKIFSLAPFSLIVSYYVRVYTPSSFFAWEK